MADIKSYKTSSHSLNNGQVLPRPYKYEEARIVFKEMIETLCAELYAKKMVTQALSWWVSYDYKSLDAVPDYDGPLSLDFYGRVHPKHSVGAVKIRTLTNNAGIIAEALLGQFDARTDHRLLYRRLGVAAENILPDEGVYQMDLFTDYEELERDRRLQGAMLEVRKKYGANAVFKGMDLLPGATTLERNQQIGGHRA